MVIYRHLLASVWEVPPKKVVQTCIAPPRTKTAPEGAAVAYTFSSDAGRSKGYLSPLPLLQGERSVISRRELTRVRGLFTGYPGRSLSSGRRSRSGAPGYDVFNLATQTRSSCPALCGASRNQGPLTQLRLGSLFAHQAYASLSPKGRGFIVRPLSPFFRGRGSG